MTAADKDPIALLGKDGLFRFAYVPFVVAEAAWDQTDTLLDIAAQQRLDCKPLSRAVRQLRRDYSSLRSRFIDGTTLDREQENMELFLHDLRDYFAKLNSTLRNAIAAQFPELNAANKMFLTAVYTARATTTALVDYCEAQRAHVASIVGHPIGRQMPPQLYRLAELLPLFSGDCELLPAPGDHADTPRRRFAQAYDSFVRTLTNQINDIQLNDTEPQTNH